MRISELAGLEYHLLAVSYFCIGELISPVLNCTAVRASIHKAQSMASYMCESHDKQLGIGLAVGTKGSDS
jgi:hypothetical protein